MFISGLKVSAKPIFPARCRAVKGICITKALSIVCPNIGANKTPVIKSKIMVAKNAKTAKLKAEDLNLLK
ncbi:MAG: hypothetical protein NT161_00155 [Candidatus Nomurabacteria bacterium]|nr:hypothetical protein [Candidatus Nomurabacteria bacterium]